MKAPRGSGRGSRILGCIIQKPSPAGTDNTVCAENFLAGDGGQGVQTARCESAVLTLFRSADYRPGGTPVFPPQRIIDLDAKLEWEIVDRTLLQSLNMLYEQLLRKRASVNIKELSPFPDDFDLMALLCLGERRIRGEPCLTVDGNCLFSELCRLVTSPALTGLVVSLEVYGMHLHLAC